MLATVATLAWTPVPKLVSGGVCFVQGYVALLSTDVILDMFASPRSIIHRLGGQQFFVTKKEGRFECMRPRGNYANSIAPLIAFVSSAAKP